MSYGDKTKVWQSRGAIFDRIFDSRQLPCSNKLRYDSQLLQPSGLAIQVLIAFDGIPISLEAVRPAGSILAAQRDEIVFYYSRPGRLPITSLGTVSKEIEAT